MLGIIISAHLPAPPVRLVLNRPVLLVFNIS